MVPTLLIGTDITMNNIDLARQIDQQLKKKYPGYLGGVGTKCSLEPCEFIPSGIFTLDKIIGGGIPRGKVIEMYSGESCGKTTIALQLIAEMQKRGHFCAFLDFERTLDVHHMERLNVRNDMMAVFEPDHAEQGLDFIVDILKSNLFSGIIVVDSIAAMKSKERMDKSAEESTMASEARLLSSITPKIVKLASDCNATVLFLNQLRKNLGAYGAPDTPAGGGAMKYYASVRLLLKRKKDGDPKDPPGIHITVQSVKNKLSQPFRSGELDILFPHIANGEETAGVDTVLDAVLAAIELGILTKAGSFITLPDGTKIQGIAKTRDYYSDVSKLNQLYTLLTSHAKEITTTTANTSADQEDVSG